MRVTEGLVSPWLRIATAGGVVFFPSFLLLMPSGDSYIFTLLAVFSAVAYFQQRDFQGFLKYEKLYFILVLLFVVVALLNYFITGTNSVGLKKLTRYLYFLMIFPFIGLFLRTRLKASYIWFGVMLGAVLAGGLAIYEWGTIGKVQGWFPRVDGALNAIRFGGISIFLSISCAVGFLHMRKSNRLLSWLMLLSSCLGFFAALASGTRGAWLILPFYAVVLVVVYWRGMSVRLKMLLVVTSIAAPLLLYFIPQTQVASRIHYSTQDVSSYFKDEGDVRLGNVRLEMWRNAYQLFRESPLIGVGLGQYKNKTHENVEAGLIHPMVAEFRNPHSTYMSTLSTQGIVGLVLAVSVIAWPLLFTRPLMRRRDEVGAFSQVTVLLIVGYLVLMFTNDLMDVKAPVMFFSVIMAQLMYIIRTSNNAQELPQTFSTDIA